MRVTISEPKVEQAGNVKIVTFTGSRIRDDMDNFVASDLTGQTDDPYATHLLLDFSNVESISSLELATLVNLHKRTEACGGRLTLFNLSAEVFDVFTITRLHRLLEICRGPATPAPV